MHTEDAVKTLLHGVRLHSMRGFEWNEFAINQRVLLSVQQYQRCFSGIIHDLDSEYLQVRPVAYIRCARRHRVVVGMVWDDVVTAMK